MQHSHTEEKKQKKQKTQWYLIFQILHSVNICGQGLGLTTVVRRTKALKLRSPQR